MTKNSVAVVVLVSCRVLVFVPMFPQQKNALGYSAVSSECTSDVPVPTPVKGTTCENLQPVAFQLPSAFFRFLLYFRRSSGHWAWNDVWTSGKGKVIKARLPGEVCCQSWCWFQNGGGTELPRPESKLPVVQPNLDPICVQRLQSQDFEWRLTLCQQP